MTVWKSEVLRKVSEEKKNQEYFHRILFQWIHSKNMAHED